METTKNLEAMTIRDIEAMDEYAAFDACIECMQIKNHRVYFVDFGGYFGYSVLVFLDGKHMYYANDYALHHRGKTANELKSFYIADLKRKLFTDDEFDDVNSYSDYKAKEDYLYNLLPQTAERMSMFFIPKNKADEEAHKRKIQGLHFCEVGFSYYEDKSFIKRLKSIKKRLENAQATKISDFDYWKSAFYYEMCNHEYAYNWEGDFDVISCFANVKHDDYANTEWYLHNAAFNAVQKSAYYAAKQEYDKLHNDM